MGLLTKKKVITIKKPVKKTEQKKKSSFSFFKSKKDKQNKDTAQESSKTRQKKKSSFSFFKSKKDKQNKDTAQEIFKTSTIKKNKPKEKFTYKFLMTKQKNNSTNQSEKPTPSSNLDNNIIRRGLFTQKVKKPIKPKKQKIKTNKKSFLSKKKTNPKDEITTDTQSKKSNRTKFSFFKNKDPKLVESDNIKEYSDEAKKLLITGALKTSVSEFPYEKKLKKFKFKPENVSTSINGIVALSVLLVIIISSYFFISQSILNPILNKQRDNIKTQNDLEQEANTLGYQIPALNKKIEEINDKVSLFDTKTFQQNDLDKLYADLTAASLEYDIKMSFSEKDSRPLSVSSKSKESLYKVVTVVLSVESSYINYLKFRYKALVESGMNVRILSEDIKSIDDNAGESQSNNMSDREDYNLLINLSFEVLEKVN